MSNARKAGAIRYHRPEVPMPDFLVISLLIIGPIGIWVLMRFLNKSGQEPKS